MTKRFNNIVLTTVLTEQDKVIDEMCNGCVKGEICSRAGKFVKIQI